MICISNANVFPFLQKKKYSKLQKPATCYGKQNYAKFGLRSPYQKIVLCYCDRDEIYVKKRELRRMPIGA